MHYTRVKHMNTNEEPTSANAESTTSTSETTNRHKERRINWDDPNVTVGNAPPVPRWPLFAAGLAWLGWVVFLVVMLTG